MKQKIWQNPATAWWSGGWDMYKSDNLAWLTNYTTARTNLSVYSISATDILLAWKVWTTWNETIAWNKNFSWDSQFSQLSIWTANKSSIFTLWEWLTSWFNLDWVTQTTRWTFSRIWNAEINMEVKYLHSTTSPIIDIYARANSDTTAYSPVTNWMVVKKEIVAGRATTSYKELYEKEIGVDSTWTISDTSMPWKVVEKITPNWSKTPVTFQTITNDWVKTLEKELGLKQVSTPSTNPASWYNKIYFKNDNKLYKLTSAWVETEVGATAWATFETSIDWNIYTWTIAYFVATTTQTIAWVYASLLSLPTWSNVTIQVYKNWLSSTNSIFTSDTPLSITTTTWATNWVYSVLDTAIDNWSIVAWDIIYVVITAIWSTLPWSSLYCKIY